MSHSVHARTDVGREREGNEDSFRTLLREDGIWLLVVCDGMGGHEGGEIASRVAVETLIERLGAADAGDPPARIREAIVAANAAVVAEGPLGGMDMGTTVVVAWVEENRFWYGWVGDSRMYHLRGAERKTVTVDHTRVQALVDMGFLKPEQVHGHPESHILMQALGGGPGAQSAFSPSVSADPIELLPGDVIFLSSDGLHDLVEEKRLPLLMHGKSAELATEALIQEALEEGGYDNVTVALLIASQEQVPKLPEEIEESLKRKPRPPLVADTPPTRQLPAWIPIGLGMVLGVVVGLMIGGLLIM